MNEVWKPVIGFEGIYSVSNRNRLKREKGQTSNGRQWAEKILTPRRNKDGYVRYTLYRDGKPHYVVLHRLVCEAFHGPAPEGKPLVLHRDDDPANNTPENLYWGDLSDNQSDVIRNGNNYGRNKLYCVNGHEYTEENTYRNKKGHRSCKTCRYTYTALSNEAAKEKRRKQIGDGTL